MNSIFLIVLEEGPEFFCALPSLQDKEFSQKATWNTYGTHMYEFISQPKYLLLKVVLEVIMEGKRRMC